MSTAEIETPETEVAAPAKKKAPAKKSPPKAAAVAAKGKTAKKAPVKKVAAKSAPVAKKSGGLSDKKMSILKFIAGSNKSVTRGLLAEKLDIKSGYCSLLGHADTEKTEPQSLAGLGLVKVVQHEGEPTSYEITAAGRKALGK